MGLVAATTVGLVIWIVGWALGAKAIDAFLVTVIVLLVGAAFHVVPTLPGNREA